MSPLIQHILLHAVSPAVFFVVVANPGNVLTCRMRGLVALVIAFASFLAGLGAAILAAKRRKSGDPESQWWVASSLILAVPAFALIILA